MPFTPIVWIDGSVLITPARLRHMETQHEQAVADGTSTVRDDNTSPLKPGINASEPSGETGLMYYNSTDGKMYGYNGDEYVLLSEV